MSWHLLSYLWGWLMLIAGLILLAPLPFADSVSEFSAFFIPAFFSASVGGAMIYIGRAHRQRVLVREGACFLVGVWAYLSFVSAIPYVISGILSPLSALSESISSLTTTGLTVLSDSAPESMIFWRSLTQWTGGLNVILLLVTVIPQVSGWFGMSLALPKNIAFGQLLAPMGRIAAGVLAIYAAATAITAVLFLAVGYGAFDSMNLALVTLATGGCYDPAQKNISAEITFIVKLIAMIFASGNFLLYWSAIKRCSVRELITNSEMRALFYIIFFFGMIVSLHLLSDGIYEFPKNFQYGFFQVAAFISTTGSDPEIFRNWPDFDKFILFFMAFIGGCIASSTGGFKIMRFLVLGKAAILELSRTLHPRMMLRISVGSLVVPLKMVWNLLCFFSLFIGAYFFASLLLAMTGLSPIASMELAAAALTSTGPAALLSGDVGAFAGLGDGTRVICCALMVLGRLEIFSFLIALQTMIHQMRRW